MGQCFNEFIHLFKASVAAQLFGSHADSFFELACQMPAANAEMVRQLVDGDAAFTGLDSSDGFLNKVLIAKIGCQVVCKVRIGGLHSFFGRMTVILDILDKPASSAPPKVLHIGILVDQLMGCIFKKGVAAARSKADSEQTDRAGRLQSHRPVHRSGDSGSVYAFGLPLAIDDINRCRQIECEFETFSQKSLTGARNDKRIDLQGPITLEIRLQA